MGRTTYDSGSLVVLSGWHSAFIEVLIGNRFPRGITTVAAGASVRVEQQWARPRKPSQPHSPDDPPVTRLVAVDVAAVFIGYARMRATSNRLLASANGLRGDLRRPL